MSDFRGFPKIPRLNREIVITEKIDGTNAQIYLFHDVDGAGYESKYLTMRVASRNRWITPDDDNAGFARWAFENEAELTKLGEGQHFGEWWGRGIQRGYDLNEKRFSLFNSHRWVDETVRPKCCGVVPQLYVGPLNTDSIAVTVNELREFGSVAAPGFNRPEGVIIYHTASKQMYKVTCQDDEKHKGEL